MRNKPAAAAPLITTPRTDPKKPRGSRTSKRPPKIAGPVNPRPKRARAPRHLVAAGDLPAGTPQTARKRTPPPLAAAVIIPADVVDKTIVLLATIRSAADVYRYAIDATKGLGLSPVEADAAIAEARRKIHLAAAVDHDFELGKAQTRLADLFQKATKTQDYKTALAIQKELNRLLALYPNRATITAGDGQAEDLEGILEELSAARGHLAPLVNATDDEPLDDIARRVVALFTAGRNHGPRAAR